MFLFKTKDIRVININTEIVEIRRSRDAERNEYSRLISNRKFFVAMTKYNFASPIIAPVSSRLNTRQANPADSRVSRDSCDL